MMSEFQPGDKVINPNNNEWGVGLVQSVINNKITVSFENAGKKVIILNNIKLEKFINDEYKSK
ncbi:DUF3553 domain-containing protein [Candidatus Pelagibacter sp.]|nr:DUF3553 domain-containing protein [Candidatus Pelagibacter sp.]